MPKRALIVEGGGMRGAHSAGALSELSQHMASTDFDVVCGSSAGSCTAAYWVAEQPELFETIWGDYLHGRRFIQFRRLLLPGPVMNLDYLLDEIFIHEAPLNIKQIATSSIDFFITTTDCHTGKAVYFHNKKKIPILHALRAGAAMPVAYPVPVAIETGLYADGGIAEPIPYQPALDADCDELWFILTKPKGYRKPQTKQSSWPKWLFRRYPALAQAIIERPQRYNQQMEQIELWELSGRARVIRPSTSHTSRFTRKQDKIHAAIAQGRLDAAQIITRLT